MKKILSLFVSVSIICSLFTVSFAVDQNQILKIGIFYGSNAMPTANLLNFTGSGYGFGYYDANRSFVPLGETGEEALTIMKDKPIYLENDGSYSDALTSSSKKTIGSYKLELSQSFGSFGEAAAYAAKFTAGYPAFVGGSFRVRIGAYATQKQAESAQAAFGDEAMTVVGEAGGAVTVVKSKTDTILFQYSGNPFPLGVRPRGEDTQTWFKGYKYRGGFEYSRSGGDITVINVVDMQGYVKGVVPYEMNPSWHKEALKAQALSARSYAMGSLGKHSKSGFDLCKTVDCQVYNGSNSATANSDGAVDETLGEYITHSGKVATGFFHSSNGGATENSENVWNNAVPYLKGVKDNFENLSGATNGIWSVTLTNSQVQTILNAKGVNNSKGGAFGAVENLAVDRFTDMGNVYSISVTETNGTVTKFEKERARTVLNSSANNVSVNSQRYKIGGGTGAGYFINDQNVSEGAAVYIVGGNQVVDSKNGMTGMTVLTAEGQTTLKQSQASQGGVYTISGTGWGHNVGMSQYGAKSMAEQGYSYSDIIKFYFTGVEITK